MHDSSQVGSQFGIILPPETHYTMHRVIEDSLRTFVYSPFILEHRLVRGVHVHNPPRLAPAKHRRIEPHIPFLSARVLASSHSLRALRIPQPCRAVGATRAHHSLRRHVSSQHRSSGSRGALSHHTHTHSLLPPPAVARSTTANPPRPPYSPASYFPSLSNCRAYSTSAIQ